MQFKVQPLVRKSFVLAVGICLGIVPFTPQVQAALTMNGRALNGVTINGVRFNGIQLNKSALGRTPCPTPQLRSTDLNCTPTVSLYLKDGQLVGLRVAR